MIYATLAQLKAYLQISSTSDDTLLSDLLVRATETISAHCRTSFAVTSDTTRIFGWSSVQWDGDTQRGYLLLPGGVYLAAITGIAGEDQALIPLTEVVSFPPAPPYTVLARVGRPWLRRTDGVISITGRWGYSVTPPPDIVHACIRLAAWYYRQRGGGLDADRPTITADGTLVYPLALPADVYQILNQYNALV